MFRRSQNWWFVLSSELKPRLLFVIASDRQHLSALIKDWGYLRLSLHISWICSSLPMQSFSIFVFKDTMASCIPVTMDPKCCSHLFFLRLRESLLTAEVHSCLLLLELLASSSTCQNVWQVWMEPAKGLAYYATGQQQSANQTARYCMCIKWPTVRLRKALYII